MPVLDFLSAALLSAEYDRALSRALAMAECPVVPFFGAFLRELREILASGPPGHDPAAGSEAMPPPKPPKADMRRDRDQQQQQRQVVGEKFSISAKKFLYITGRRAQKVAAEISNSFLSSSYQITMEKTTTSPKLALADSSTWKKFIGRKP